MSMAHDRAYKRLIMGTMVNISCETSLYEELEGQVRQLKQLARFLPVDSRKFDGTRKYWGLSLSIARTTRSTKRCEHTQRVAVCGEHGLSNFAPLFVGAFLATVAATTTRSRSHTPQKGASSPGVPIGVRARGFGRRPQHRGSPRRGQGWQQGREQGREQRRDGPSG